MTMKKKSGKTVLGMAWYQADQWDELRAVSADVDDLESTYEEWLAFAERKLSQLRAKGVILEKVPVDLDELVQWCESEGVKVDGRSRANFAAHKVRLQYESSE